MREEFKIGRNRALLSLGLIMLLVVLIQTAGYSLKSGAEGALQRHSQRVAAFDRVGGIERSLR